MTSGNINGKNFEINGAIEGKRTLLLSSIQFLLQVLKKKKEKRQGNLEENSRHPKFLLEFHTQIFFL